MRLWKRPWTGHRWLWRYLWGWTLGVLLLTWVVLGGVAFLTGLREADEINDTHLVQTAALLLRVKAVSGAEPLGRTQAAAQDAAQDQYFSGMRVVAWEDGRQTWDTHGMAARLPPSLTDGHHTLVLVVDGSVRSWRLYATTHTTLAGRTRRVAVMTDNSRRTELALDMAEHIVLPAVALFPLVALLLVVAIRRGLRPLNQLSADMAALDVRAGQRLTGQQAFVELESTVQAIHHLVDQLQQQWARERQFNADVAHELRTPLTSLVLQAHLAQTAEAAQRSQALRQLEADALRAASILKQLLDLARAQRGVRTGERVDLCALAQQICADHLPLAHEWGQTLALDAPAEPVEVSGHAELLGLALRNLVDNALRHNPRGTCVEVAVQQTAEGARVLSVTDDGQFQTGMASRPGMGVGLTLVRRIADAQGATLQHEPDTAPANNRFALIWPPQNRR